MGKRLFQKFKSIDYENRYTVLAYGFEEKDSYLSVGGINNKNINSVTGFL
ncbi:MAG: hypothetical protein CM15mP102_12140 [Flavobacteriales bacterium]|nr:MAG: hypothetical protein CM15mP102_12140 [Flavobacteriales bacterium]